MLSIGLMTIIGSGGGGGSDYGEPDPFSIYYSVDIADLNNDGHQDIAGARTYISHPPPHEGSVSLLYYAERLYLL